jgi:hypothetical protein
MDRVSSETRRQVVPMRRWEAPVRPPAARAAWRAGRWPPACRSRRAWSVEGRLAYGAHRAADSRARVSGGARQHRRFTGSLLRRTPVAAGGPAREDSGRGVARREPIGGAMFRDVPIDAGHGPYPTVSAHAGLICSRRQLTKRRTWACAPRSTRSKPHAAEAIAAERGAQCAPRPSTWWERCAARAGRERRSRCHRLRRSRSRRP